MRRFYAPKEGFRSDAVTLDADETRHLRDVLRLKKGSEVNVFDGQGGEFRCEILAVGKTSSELAVLGEATQATPESHLHLTLAAAILKGEKFDLVIQKAVELGVTALVPLQTVRCDVKLNDVPKRLGRWRRIALEATKQCGRARLMQIAEPNRLSEFIAEVERKSTFLFSERDGGPFPSASPGNCITAIVGPEGGWDDSELEAAAARGINIVTLGGRILRAETAAITIAAVIQHRFGDLK